jgi:hypothetical protein
MVKMKGGGHGILFYEKDKISYGLPALAFDALR